MLNQFKADHSSWLAKYLVCFCTPPWKYNERACHKKVHGSSFKNVDLVADQKVWFGFDFIDGKYVRNTFTFKSIVLK
jgi:hypothetical protein